MKFRYALIMLVALAGFGASIALADEGHGKNDPGKADCHRGVVFGTLSGPQTFTLTVVKANGRSGFAPGQTVTVNLGPQGAQLWMMATGCVGADGALTVREAELHARNPNARKHEGGDTTQQSTTTTDSTPGTTTTNQH